MRSQRMIVLVVLFALLFAGLPVGAAPVCPEPVTKTVRKLVKEKEEAVNRGDREGFLRVINPNRRAYFREQKRWFEDAIRFIDPGSFRLDVQSIIPGKPFQVRVFIRQSYRKDGKTYSVTYPLRFEKTEQGWRDSDIFFDHLAAGDVAVFYTDSRLKNQAAVALDIVDRAVEAFRQKFGWEPVENIEVKLYHDPKLFRHSVKLSLPEWAAGWNEAGQSIKFVGALGMDDWEGTFASGLVHEVTHKMVSELTGDNAAYWLQEGVAEYYQTRLLPGLRNEPEPREITRPWRFSTLESLQLEKLPLKEASQYYAQSGAFFGFLVEHYGEEKLQEVFAALRQFPTIDRDSTDKIPELNRRTRAAIRKALGKPVEQLEREWLKSRENGISNRKKQAG